MNVIPALQAFRGKRLNPAGVPVDFSLEHADGLSLPKRAQGDVIQQSIAVLSEAAVP
jgi:hypothetical protein